MSVRQTSSSERSRVAASGEVMRETSGDSAALLLLLLFLIIIFFGFGLRCWERDREHACGPPCTSDAAWLFSTNGANHTSPGQRPGIALRENKALKGRDRIVPPLQGFDLFVADDPGRCPGLVCGRAVGPQCVSDANVHDTL